MTAKKQRGAILPWVFTPVLLLLLCMGIVMLVLTLAPVHTVQKYLNLAFMDTLKTNSTTAGLNIIDKVIQTDDGRETSETGTIMYPKFGEQYAQLECKSIDLNIGVHFGVSKELLALGACQSSQSAVLGEDGNTVIDAHVNTFFADLNKLQVGDDVTLYTEYGVFRYRVTEQIRFLKTDNQYVLPTEEPCLTLYTCEAQVLGNSDVRVGVRCELISKAYYTE